MSARSRIGRKLARAVAPHLALVLALGTVLLAAAPARAFHIRDPLHHGCHERITIEALRAYGYRGGITPPVPNHDEGVFIERQAFETSLYPRNMLALALLIGNRSNDTSGLGSTTILNLTGESNSDAHQPENCLRRLSDNGEQGARDALRRCRDAIMQEVDAALDGLAPDGSVDPFATDLQPVFIPYQDTVDWPLSRFYFHAGRALHTLEDSFTHTFRDPTWRRVLTVATWVDPVRGDYDEQRDGPQHWQPLDACDEPRPWRAEQIAAATAAASDLYGALLSASATSRDAARAEVNTVLDRWLTFQGGCGLDNGYCGSAVYQDQLETGGVGVSACTCEVGRAAPRARAPMGVLGLVLLALGAVVLRRRRRIGVGLVLLVLALPQAVRAQQPAGRATPAGQATSAGPAMSVGQATPAGQAMSMEPATPAAKAPAVEPVVTNPLAPSHRPLTLRGFGRVGGSLNHPAWALGGGAVLGWRSIEVELAAEWNPFVSLDRVGMDAGTINIFAATSWRWGVSPKVDITSGLGLGLSILLFETVGTPAGNVGPFLIARPLGVIRHLGRRAAVAINAFEVCAPIPQTRGWPLAIIQYRISAAVRF